MIFVIHTAIFAQFSSFGWVIMATDALVSNFIFSLFGIGLWYVILYYTPKIQNVFNVVFNHFSVFVVWVLIWIFLSYEILTLSFADNAGYLIFFQQSIPVRVAAAFFIYITTGSL
jgi:hypothetical protein